MAEKETRRKKTIQYIHTDAAQPGIEVCPIILAVTVPGKTGSDFRSDFLEMLETTLVLLFGTYQAAYTSDEKLAVLLAQKACSVSMPRIVYKGLNRALPCAPNLSWTAVGQPKMRFKRRQLYDA